jgi:hypothetical protein
MQASWDPGYTLKHLHRNNVQRGAQGNWQRAQAAHHAVSGARGLPHEARQAFEAAKTGIARKSSRCWPQCSAWTGVESTGALQQCPGTDTGGEHRAGKAGRVQGGASTEHTCEARLSRQWQFITCAATAKPHSTLTALSQGGPT